MNFSGQVLVRMPKELHLRLAKSAEENNVSLNLYIVILLSINESRLAFSEQMKFPKEDILKFKEDIFMGQDLSSGKRGNDVGRFVGEAIAKKLGIQLNKGSNKGIYKSRVIVIKSASIRNNQFGITNRMAEEIDDVILAKENIEGHFDLYLVEFEKIKDTGRPTASKGSSRGRVTNYRVSKGVSEGFKFDSIQIDLDIL